jgi:hypothetical protein
MRFFKDLLAFYREVRRATHEKNRFVAQPDWWLTHNVNAYWANTYGNKANNVCAYFWTALLIYPLYVLAGKRVSLGRALLWFVSSWIATFGLFLLIGPRVGLSLSESQTIGLITATAVGVIGAVFQFDMVYESKIWDVFLDTESNSRPAQKPKIYSMLGTKVETVASRTLDVLIYVPWKVLEHVKDNACPLVYYKD